MFAQRFTSIVSRRYVSTVVDLYKGLINGDRGCLAKCITLECLSNEKLREFVPDECRRLSYTFFECKRSMIDMRSRFRGRKGEIY
ncbi:unnamed protein product [Rotaria sordida]|uniref:Cytochrome c oxidase assembly factor 5 n=1 Tax=Rotaria sordida TaxID=392033 RepID=A0A814DXN6_9BILA|nr:unnamed protein product [Rotaria sordida]